MSRAPGRRTRWLPWRRRRRHDLGIVHSAATGDQVGRPSYGTLHGESDGSGGEHGGGGDQVAERRTGLPESGDELLAVLLAPGALRRLAAVVGIAQQVVEQRAV